MQSPLNPEAVKKAQKESRDKVPAGGFIDLGKYLSVLSTLLSENVAKIAPKVKFQYPDEKGEKTCSDYDMNQMINCSHCSLSICRLTLLLFLVSFAE